MASKLQAGFKFEIGEYVALGSHVIHGQPRPYMVTSRSIEECHGGVQTHYKLDGLTGWIPSIAVVPMPSPSMASIIEAIQKTIEGDE